MPIDRQVEPITWIHVMGKSADEVVNEVLEKIKETASGKGGKVTLFSS